jgi:membrane protein YfhO
MSARFGRWFRGLSASRRDLWVGLGLLLLAFLLYYWQVVFASRLVSAEDLLSARYLPFMLGVPPTFKPGNPALTDSVVSLAPAMSFVRESLASGQLPLWNPYTEFGYPFFAQSQWGVLSPVQLPFLVPPGVYSIYTAQTLVGMIKIAVAGTGAYLFARRLRLSMLASVFAGIAWMLGGYTTAWLSMPASAVTVFIPWICLAYEATLTGERPWFSAAGLALAMGCAIAGGHPEALLYSFLAILIYGLVRAFQEWRLVRAEWRVRAGAVACAIVLAAGIGAVIMIPAVELLHQSVDSTLRSLEHRDTAIAWNNLLLVFDPDHFGSRFARGTFYSAYAAPWYDGVIAAIAAIAAIAFRDRRVAPFALMGIVALLIGMNTWPWRELEAAIPLLGASPKSAPLVMWAFGLSMAGAIGVHRVSRLFAGKRWRPWVAPAVAALLCAVLFGELYIWGHNYNPRVPRNRVGVPPPAQLAAIPSGAGAPRTVFLGHTMPFLLPMGHNLPEIRSYGQPTRKDYDAFMRRDITDLSRVFNPSEIGYPVANLRPGTLKLLAALNTRYVAFSDGVWNLKGLRKVATGPLNVYENPAALPRAFAVSDFTVEPNLQSTLDRVAGKDFDPRKQVVLDRQPPGLTARGPAPASGQTRITRYRNDHVKIHATMKRPGLVVLSDSGYPGWHATVDGESVPIYRADGLFRAVALPAGTHEVRFDFDPRSVKIGFLVSIVSLVLTAALALFGRRRRTGARRGG